MVLGVLRMYIKNTGKELISLTKEQLIEWYSEKGLSMSKIAEQLGTSNGYISKKIKEFDIPKRDRSFSLIPTFNEDQVVRGTMLGDGTICKSSEKSGVLSFMHCAKQKEYIEWKAQQLTRFASPKGVKFDPMKSQDDIYYDTYVFWTRSSTYFSDIEKLYYQKIEDKRVKTITREILDQIDRLGLSVWLMDDGNRYFNVITIPVPKVVKEVVRDWFKDKWNIITDFHSLGPKKSVINVAFKSTEVKKFVDLVEEFVIPSMSYKIKVSSAVR